jgi:hypothetical protein
MGERFPAWLHREAGIVKAVIEWTGVRRRRAGWRRRAVARVYEWRRSRGPCPARNPSPLGMVIRWPSGPITMPGPKVLSRQPRPIILVILRPQQERIVGRVKNHHSAAAANIGFQGALGIGRPLDSGRQVAAVDVIDHHVVVREIRQFGVGRDVHRESPGAFRNCLDGARSRSPIVVIDAIDDHRQKFPVGG